MSRTATTINRLNNLLEITTLDTAIGPKYTGAPQNGSRLCLASGVCSGLRPCEGSQDEARDEESQVIYGRGVGRDSAALGVVQGMLDKAAAQAKQVPRFEVDPFWPKPMPKN